MAAELEALEAIRKECKDQLIELADHPRARAMRDAGEDLELQELAHLRAFARRIKGYVDRVLPEGSA